MSFHRRCLRGDSDTNPRTKMSTAHGFSISVKTKINYQETIEYLREALTRFGFEGLHELPLDRELERKAGLRWPQLGLSWRHYTVLLVWSPLDACPALLSDRDGGLLVPFNLCVAEGDNVTFIAAANHFNLLRPGNASIGTQTLLRDLSHRIRGVLSELETQQDGARVI